MSERIVCWFSCGVASAVATKLAIVNNAGKLPLVIARCVVREEHPDNERFAKECEAWFGQPILNLINEEHNGSVYSVIAKTKLTATVHGYAPCTNILKKDLRLSFQQPEDIHVFGYTLEEADRLDRFIDANNVQVWSVLIENNLTHEDCMALVEKQGIELPVMYKLGYEHNNCIGCSKANGAGYWNMIRRDFGEQFKTWAELSRSIGSKMTRVNNVRIYLDELPENYGDYSTEPKVQCGIFCEMANDALTPPKEQP